MSLEEYNQLWKKGEINKPLIIIIGGAAGTGKSTLAEKLKEYIPNLQIVSTGIIRSVLQSVVNEGENPEIFKHTYDCQDINEYLIQAEAINKALKYLVNFYGSEKQLTVIEGSNIVPGMIQKNPNVFLIDAYIKVSDEKIHLEMLGGPTHNRNLNDKEFLMSKEIQDYIISQAEKFDKPIFEYSKALEGILREIDASLF